MADASRRITATDAPVRVPPAGNMFLLGLSNGFDTTYPMRLTGKVRCVRRDTGVRDRALTWPAPAALVYDRSAGRTGRVCGHRGQSECRARARRAARRGVVPGRVPCVRLHARPVPGASIVPPRPGRWARARRGHWGRHTRCSLTAPAFRLEPAARHRSSKQSARSWRRRTHGSTTRYGS